MNSISTSTSLSIDNNDNDTTNMLCYVIFRLRLKRGRNHMLRSWQVLSSSLKKQTNRHLYFTSSLNTWADLKTFHWICLCGVYFIYAYTIHSFIGYHMHVRVERRRCPAVIWKFTYVLVYVCVCMVVSATQPTLAHLVIIKISFVVCAIYRCLIRPAPLPLPRKTGMSRTKKDIICLNC